MADTHAIAPRAQQSELSINVGSIERVASAFAGGFLACYGLRKANLPGLAMAALGGALIYRGASGQCSVYKSLGYNTAGNDNHGSQTSVKADHGVKLEKCISVNRPIADVYRFWKQLENLPRVMSHLKSVEKIDNKRSRWTAKGLVGINLTWEAETLVDKPNDMISWRSLPGSDVDTAGSVHFSPENGNRTTKVQVTLKYDPPAGKVGAAIANLLGAAPEQQIETDLKEFKRLFESGAIKA